MREIKKIILHYSETPATWDGGVEEIRAWHKERGFTDIGYHYVIRKNGDIQAGRGLEWAGAHCKGQNEKSIGICYIGGEDEKDDRTQMQRQALLDLIYSLKTVFPQHDITVHGHNEFSNKKCPGFNVGTEL